MGWEVVDYISFAQYRDTWRAHVKTVINFDYHTLMIFFLTS